MLKAKLRTGSIYCLFVILKSTLQYSKLADTCVCYGWMGLCDVRICVRHGLGSICNCIFDILISIRSKECQLLELENKHLLIILVCFPWIHCIAWSLSFIVSITNMMMGIMNFIFHGGKHTKANIAMEQDVRQLWNRLKWRYQVTYRELL